MWISACVDVAALFHVVELAERGGDVGRQKAIQLLFGPHAEGALLLGLRIGCGQGIGVLGTEM